MENQQVIDEALDGVVENAAVERDMYQQSCFGHFQLMQQGMVRFFRVEFSLITGLKFGAIPDTELYEDVLNDIHHKYFSGRDAVTFAELEARIEQGQWQKQFNVVKLCLMYMLNYVLIRAEERNSIHMAVAPC
ncbi:hypothetical protein Dsin_013432 [Dipteronia sinensis]|uniref:DUF1985 domain-containing protein n=1 Tax=Dipteronia sinensis TaxID=43782 RepID=A0AAE0AL49_9ROSI|nr:hypothetical protein Dsin_013432 [Dipteronia sinensis]